MTTDAIFDDILAMRPVDTTYVAGRWHHDRATAKGVWLEARVLLKSLTVSRNDNTRFLIVGRARSGTTLLTKLLNGHSQITCDGEVLKRFMISPQGYLNRLAGKSTAPVYGAKVLSYQMAQVHRMRRPDLFLQNLSQSGVHLIHLERDTFFQTLSLTVAQERRQYHSDKGAKTPGNKVELDPENFLDRLRWSDALLRYERAAFARLEHTKIVYETDLAEPETQLATLARLCDRLGVTTEPVDIPLKKILPSEPSEIIGNFDEVKDAMIGAGLGHLLP